ncbi:MAG: CoA pyrophosphatase [Xanthobacteraceae bacterium]|nr:CoA pyrophosphatase [Xanthobacteraceae bacterium]
MSSLRSRAAPAPLSEPVQAFVRRARERLASAPSQEKPNPAVVPLRGDHELTPELANVALPAAVLIPVVAREQPTILFTQRTAALPVHAGQIAFPGGKMHPEDADPLATALREAEEEIGLARRFADPLGYLDTYLTRTGFHIVPVVALIAPAFELSLNRGEVDEVFEVPLGFLMAPENHARHSRELNGVRRSFYAMPYGERYIWGVTAGILRDLYERLYR